MLISRSDVIVTLIGIIIIVGIITVTTVVDVNKSIDKDIDDRRRRSDSRSLEIN